MKRLHKLNMRPAEAMQPLPKLASGVDPYKKINKRYLDHDERIHIADWRREGVSIREIGECPFVCVRGAWFTSSPRIGRGKPRLVG
ncbi:transposase-like protein [Corynebacterium diphtheriae]|nr:transposase-like protein [Corynebacterium diphtheriae]